MPSRLSWLSASPRRRVPPVYSVRSGKRDTGQQVVWGDRGQPRFTLFRPGRDRPCVSRVDLAYGVATKRILSAAGDCARSASRSMRSRTIRGGTG